jgi:hypothetical protein
VIVPVFPFVVFDGKLPALGCVGLGWMFVCLVRSGLMPDELIPVIVVSIMWFQ